MIYGLEQLSALGNIFITLTFRIPYTLYRISFIVAATINRVWLIEYGKWNLVAVICILFITYSHFLTIWLHFVASCECPYSPPSLWTGSYIWATFVCTPKLFACMTINFIQLLPSSPSPHAQKSFSRSPTTENYGNNNNNIHESEVKEGEHKLKLKCLFTLRMNQWRVWQEGWGGGVSRGNNCQGSFLCNICILTPLYASCGYDSPFPPFFALPRLASLELLQRICLVAYQANGIKQPVGKGERERVRWCDVEGRVQPRPNRSLQHLATFCFNFALLKSGSRHLDALLMLPSAGCQATSQSKSKSQSQSQSKLTLQSPSQSQSRLAAVVWLQQLIRPFIWQYPTSLWSILWGMHCTKGLMRVCLGFSGNCMKFNIFIYYL